MAKYIVLAWVATFLGICAFTTTAKPRTPAATITLQGAVDDNMLNLIRGALEDAKARPDRRVRFYLLSPGGSGIVGVEAARLIRDASDREGVVVEMYTASLCASACTIIFASGTPGYRVVNQQTLFLVHPMQGGMGGCIEQPKNPETADDRAVAVVYTIVRNSYMRSTGQPYDVVNEWLTCGHEQIGLGDIAVQLKIADRVER